MTAEESNIPEQFTHSVKISETAKGIRIDVHVYANSRESAVAEAFLTYQDAIREANKLGIVLAPVEVKEKWK